MTFKTSVQERDACPVGCFTFAIPLVVQDVVETWTTIWGAREDEA